MTNLENNIIYKQLKTYDSKFISKIDTLYEHVYSVLPKMNNIFDNYTEHGIDHSLRVLNYMSQLINDVEKLSELELTMIIYVALLHDIGMVVDESEKNCLTDDSVNELGMKYSVVKEEYCNNEKKALQEYFRPIHGLRAIKYIENMQQQDLFCVQEAPGISFGEDIAKICMSHNESGDWIRANLRKSIIKEEYEANPQYIAVLLRLGDILDIDDKRTPHHIYRLFELDSYSNLEWKQHFDIDNTKKIFVDEKTGQKYVEFRGSSNEAEVHRKLLSYIDWINNELEFSSKLCSTFSDEKYALFIKEKAINRIETNGFSISDFRLTLDYKAVTGLLMGEKIYGDKKYGLREIVQNSIDACKLMQEISHPNFLRTGEEYQPHITIIFDKDDGKVKVRDNGVGMTIDILRKYFLNVGVSYYSSSDFKYKGYNYKPIGNYGIGFLACFMLSDNVTVITKHYTETSSNEIEIEKSSEFISLTNKEDLRQHGTEVWFDYSSFMQVFRNDINRVKEFIEENFLLDEIQIRLIEINQGDPNTILCESKPEMGEKAFSLNEYFDGIEANMIFKIVNEEVKKLEELTGAYSDSIYLYDEEDNKLIPCDNLGANLSLSNFIEDDKISYLEIPIIDSSISDRFENLISALEDWDEAFTKIENDINYYVYIFAKRFSDMTYTEGHIDKSDFLLGGLSFEEFCSQFESDKYNGTKVEKIERIVSHKTNLDSVLLINEKARVGYDIYSWRYTKNDKIQKIYNKNVYLSKMSVVIPYISNMINLGNITINLRHRAVVPNLARDNVDEDHLLESIGFAIGKGIHLYLLDNGDLDVDQKELLRIFIEKYYSGENIFLLR